MCIVPPCECPTSISFAFKMCSISWVPSTPPTFAKLILALSTQTQKCNVSKTTEVELRTFDWKPLLGNFSMVTFSELLPLILDNFQMENLRRENLNNVVPEGVPFPSYGLHFLKNVSGASSLFLVCLSAKKELDIQFSSTTVIILAYKWIFVFLLCSTVHYFTTFYLLRYSISSFQQSLFWYIFYDCPKKSLLKCYVHVPHKK